VARLTVGDLRKALADPVLPDGAIIDLEGCDCYGYAGSASWSLAEDRGDGSLIVVLSIEREIES
jgi:hypothetical protein